MNIEFDVPMGAVRDWVIEHVKDELLSMHHEEPALSRAEVYFRLADNSKEKICEVNIPMFGSSLYIHRSAPSFEQASRLVLDQLRLNIQERVHLRNAPPDITLSSVEVEPPEEE